MHVGHQTKMPPRIFCLKVRQKIQDQKKIQDIDDMVGKRDTGGIAKRVYLANEKKGKMVRPEKGGAKQGYKGDA